MSNRSAENEDWHGKHLDHNLRACVCYSLGAMAELLLVLMPWSHRRHRSSRLIYERKPSRSIPVSPWAVCHLAVASLGEWRRLAPVLLKPSAVFQPAWGHGPGALFQTDLTVQVKLHERSVLEIERQAHVRYLKVTESLSPAVACPLGRWCSCQVHPNIKQKDSQHPHATPPINGLNAQEGVMTSFAQTVPCFAGWGGRPGSCRLLLSLRNAPTKPIVLSSYVQASGPLDENLLEFFIVLSHKPTPSTLPSVQLPCRVFILWARFLESWNSRFLFFNTARTGGREQTLLLCDHW